MARGVHGGGVYMVGGIHSWGGGAWQERRPLKRAVRILLECILVLLFKWVFVVSPPSKQYKTASSNVV